MKNIVSSPLVSLVAIVLSGAFLLTFITVKLSMHEDSIMVLGLIHSAFYCGLLVGAIKSEEIINRVGHIRAFSSFASITTITIILQALYQTPFAWVTLRFFSGFATAAAYVIIESWLLAKSTKNNKGKILSIYMICLYSAQTVGQFGLEIVDINSFEPFLLAALLSTISIIPASLTYVQTPEINLIPKLPIKEYIKASPLGFIGCTISGMILSAIYSFLPNYALSNDFTVSTLVGSAIAGGFCLQWPIGKLSDIFDRVKIIAALSIILIFFCCIFLSGVISNFFIVCITAFFLGGVSFAIYPICIAQVCDHLEHTNIINVTGVLLFAYAIGAVFGPPIVAMFIKWLSINALFYYLASVSAILLAASAYFYRSIEPVSQDDQVDFVIMPRVSPVANELNPGTEE
jgi:MFS family permease